MKDYLPPLNPFGRLHAACTKGASLCIPLTIVPSVRKRSPLVIQIIQSEKTISAPSGGGGLPITWRLTSSRCRHGCAGPELPSKLMAHGT